MAAQMIATVQEALLIRRLKTLTPLAGRLMKPLLISRLSRLKDRALLRSALQLTGLQLDKRQMSLCNFWKSMDKTFHGKLSSVSLTRQTGTEEVKSFENV